MTINRDGSIIGSLGKVLIPQKDNKGYLRLRYNRKRWKVHRLVAITHIPNPENKPMVHHKNGIKDDNRAQNLEWVTNAENIQHTSKLNFEIVREIRQARKNGFKIKQLMAKWGMSKYGIESIIYNRSWKE